MKKFIIFSILSALIFSQPIISFAQNTGNFSGNGNQSTTPNKSVQISVNNIEDVATPAPTPVASVIPKEYTVGINDVLDIHVLKPEVMYNSVTVSPDGTIVFPYIGSVMVKDRTIAQIQDEVQSRLADGYMKYPVVSVSLAESNSRRFFVYGEVVKPGSFDMEENMTVLRAISMAGGFSQFGSASRVKVLRPKKNAGGYDVIKVNIVDVMNGVADADLAIDKGDIIVVSQGVF